MNSIADSVREYAVRHYVQPAKGRGERTLKIRAGDVHKALHLERLMPTVCQALKSKRFLNENGLAIDHVEGPPSGLGPTLQITYRMSQEGTEPSLTSPELPLMRLWGAGREVFQSLGGAESFIRSEREQFHDLYDKISGKDGR
jgi:5-methylcytosine-specific restriction protein B